MARLNGDYIGVCRIGCPADFIFWNQLDDLSRLDDLETVRDAAVKAVHDLTVQLGNPTTISEVGATEADLEGLAHDAFADVCTPGNPRQATEEDILAIYKSLM